MDEQMAAWMKYAAPADEHGYLAKLEGTAEGNVRTMYCEFIDPMGKSNQVKGVTTLVGDVEPFKQMEIVYTR